MLILWIRKYLIYISITSKVIEGQKSLSYFSVNPTFPILDGPLMLSPPNCVDLSTSFSLPVSFPYFVSIFLSISVFCSMQTLIYTQRNVFHKMMYDLKGYMRPLLCRVIFKNSQIFWSIYNLDLRSYGQLLSLFFINILADPSSKRHAKKSLQFSSVILKNF